jgi:hypothetical protein
LNCANQFLEALTLGVEDALAERREPVVAAAGVVELGGGAVVRFPDEVGFNEALDRSIECGGPEVNFAGGAFEDVLHDAVTMLFSAGEREHDVKPLGFEGEEGLEVDLGHR